MTYLVALLVVACFCSLVLVPLGCLGGSVVRWHRRRRFDTAACAKADEYLGESRTDLMVRVSTPKTGDDLDELWAELLRTPRVPTPRGAVD